MEGEAQDRALGGGSLEGGIWRREKKGPGGGVAREVGGGLGASGQPCGTTLRSRVRVPVPQSDNREAARALGGAWGASQISGQGEVGGGGP